MFVLSLPNLPSPGVHRSKVTAGGTTVVEAAQKLEYSVGLLHKAINKVWANSIFLPISIVFHRSIINLCPPFQPYHTNLRLTTVVSVPISWDNTYAVFLHVVLNKGLHSSRCDRDAASQDINVRNIEHELSKFGHPFSQYSNIGSTILQNFLSKVKDIALMLLIPLVEGFPRIFLHRVRRIKRSGGHGTDVILILLQVKVVWKIAFLEFCKIKVFGEHAESTGHEIRRVQETNSIRATRYLRGHELLSTKDWFLQSVTIGCELTSDQHSVETTGIMSNRIRSLLLQQPRAKVRKSGRPRKHFFIARLAPFGCHHSEATVIADDLSHG